MPVLLFVYPPLVGFSLRHSVYHRLRFLGAPSFLPLTTALCCRANIPCCRMFGRRGEHFTGVKPHVGGSYRPPLLLYVLGSSNPATLWSRLAHGVVVQHTATKTSSICDCTCKLVFSGESGGGEGALMLRFCWALLCHRMGCTRFGDAIFGSVSQKGSSPWAASSLYYGENLGPTEYFGGSFGALGSEGRPTHPATSEKILRGENGIYSRATVWRCDRRRKR